MDLSKKIKMILIDRNMTIKDLNDKLGYKSNYFYVKLKKNDLTEEELKKIADFLNCDFEGIFIYRDTGKKI